MRMYDTDTSYPEFNPSSYHWDHPLDAMSDDEKEAREHLLDVLWYSEDKEEIKLYRILLKALEAPYLGGSE